MSIFNHKSVNAYLKEYISHLPKKGRGEISKIASHLKVSTTLISHILSEKKTLTLEQADSLIEYLGLMNLEQDYFINLVQMERAGTTSLKKYWSKKLTEIKEASLKLSQRVKIDKVLSHEEKSIFYSSPLYSAIRLFTSVGGKGKSLGEICDRFDLPKARVATILSFLVESGLCIEKNGLYFLGAQKTHLDNQSPHLPKHLSSWRNRAIYHSENISDKELMYSAPVSLSVEDFDKLREEMANFIKKFVERVQASPAEEIACFNLDFFWIKK